MSNISEFTFQSLLARNPERTVLVAEGHFGDQRGIVILNKQPFNEREAEEVFKAKLSADETTASSNDKFKKSTVYTKDRFWNQMTAQTVCPASDQDIEKYKAWNNKKVWINETPQMYNDIIKPILMKYNSSRSTKWIDNILNGTSEQEMTIFQDSDPELGFVLQYGYLWQDRTDLDSMTLLCFLNKKNIMSIRDLKSEHVPILENILSKSLDVIEQKIGVNKKHVRAYVHYQPSFYHMHVHFSNIHKVSVGVETERAHCLQNIIDNIKLFPDYYQKKTLSYTMLEDNEIAKAVGAQ
ncbi:m7GpppX diphosphatase [Acrasis kona]|uniref:M7GpppX diphosphatase n=1 Tax=Acrasis kona TaxID=1008807 RepID=A0AAW2ZPS4_9EUKA